MKRKPRRDPSSGPTLPSEWPLSLGGALFKDEGDVHVDLVTLDVAVLDEDVHVLYPATLYVAQRLVCAVYAFLDGLLKALWVHGAQLRYACNSHSLCF